MKKLLFFVATVVALTSCDMIGGGSNRDQLKAENDSLMLLLTQRNAELDEMMGTFNDISEGFRLINAAENRVDLNRNAVGEGSLSAKEKIADDIEFIRKQMEENREQIAKLQQMLKESKNNSAQLKRAVNQLTKELEDKMQRIEELQALDKEYVATLQLGATTPSFDMEQPVDATYPTSHITRENLLETLQSFVGEIQQVPPAFSACKIDGHRAYDLARKGKDVDLRAKTLVISEIELLDFDQQAMLATIRVVCSKGTYIRALARDIGEALGSGAYLTSLSRTRVGDVRVEDCISIEDFHKSHII